MEKNNNRIKTRFNTTMFVVKMRATLRQRHTNMLQVFSLLLLLPVVNSLKVIFILSIKCSPIALPIRYNIQNYSNDLFRQGDEDKRTREKKNWIKRNEVCFVRLCRAPAFNSKWNFMRRIFCCCLSVCCVHTANNEHISAVKRVKITNLYFVWLTPIIFKCDVWRTEAEI